jgi:hypothetical protein
VTAKRTGAKAPIRAEIGRMQPGTELVEMPYLAAYPVFKA